MSPPDTLALGPVAVGSAAQDTLVLTNVGGGMLTGSFSMASGLDFVFVEGSVDAYSGVFSLPSDQPDTVVVSFAPLGPGVQTAEIDFVDGSGGSLATVVLSGEGVASETGVSRYYYLTDHLGSVRATVNASGVVVHYDDYYPFGAQMPGRSLSTPEAPKERYTGHEYDDETETDGSTGLYYARARYYDPVIPVWNSVDPSSDSYPSHSPYNYALGNPMRLVDPDGEDPCCIGVRRRFWTPERVQREKTRIANLRSEGQTFAAAASSVALFLSRAGEALSEFQRVVDPVGSTLGLGPGGVAMAVDDAARVAGGATKGLGALDDVVAGGARTFLKADDFTSLSGSGTIDPGKIRFSQNSIKPEFKNGGLVSELTEKLKSGELTAADVKPIRIVVKDGKVFTLDNRRLKAFQDAGVEISYIKLDHIPKRELQRGKFSTTNDGVSIIIRDQ